MALIAYTTRAVPWGLVLLGAAGAAALLALASVDPAALWPVQGTAVGLLAGVAAWTMDERAAAIVDTLPRGLWWRTVGRAPAALPLACAWVGAVALLAERLPAGHADLFALQGLAGVVAGAGLATWRRARGEGAPGPRLAPAIIAVVAALALLRPAPDHLPLFPVWPWEEWGLSRGIWWGVLAAAAGLVALALARD